jgi:hypothetical protein
MFMNCIYSAFIGFFSVLSISSAFAHNEGFGEGALTDPPNAICRLSIGNHPFCTGTIVKAPAFDEPKLVTAGHCFDAYKNKKELPIKAECGCTKDGCLETFILSNIEYSYIETQDSWLADHATATLDHKPTLITLIELSKAENYIDPKSNLMKPGVSCITGGYGLDINVVMTSTPNVFSITDRVIFTKKTKINQTPFLSFTVITLSKEELDKIESLKTNDPALILLKEKQISSFDLYQFVKSGTLENATLPGDSGGGLLCKINNEAYQLIATLTGTSVRTSTKVKLKNFPAVVNEIVTFKKFYSPTQPEWLIEKTIPATHSDSE